MSLCGDGGFLLINSRIMNMSLCGDGEILFINSCIMNMSLCGDGGFLFINSRIMNMSLCGDGGFLFINSRIMNMSLCGDGGFLFINSHIIVHGLLFVVIINVLILLEKRQFNGCSSFRHCGGGVGVGLWCLRPRSTIFQLYRGATVKYSIKYTILY